MFNNQQKLEMILGQAGISQPQKALWNKSFKYLEPKQIPDFLHFLESLKKEEILFFTQLLEQKISALESENPEAWAKILNTEAGYLSNVQ